MKKLIKKVVLLFAVIIGIISSQISVYATSSNDEVGYIEETVISEKFIDPELVGTYRKITVPKNNLVMLNNYGESHRKSGEYTTYKTVYVTPTGQPGLGYEGGSGDDSVFFFETGGSSIKFSVTIDYKVVSFTAETGASATYGHGHISRIPEKSGRYKFEFIKNYTIKSKKYDVYKYNEYKYSYYTHDPQYSLGKRWVKL